MAESPSLTIQIPARPVVQMAQATNADVEAGLADSAGVQIEKRSVVGPDAIYFERVEKGPDGKFEVN